MTRFAVCLLLSASVFAQKDDHPTGPRITPPTLNTVSPLGAARGTTVEMTVEGLNLARASEVYFSEPGVKGRVIRVKELPDLPDIRLGSNGTPSTVDVGPLPPRNQVTLELEISPDAPVGPVKFRVLTPLGTSPEGTFLVEPYYGESPDKEPNDTPEGAFECFLPTILAGAISKPGDVDYYKLNVKAGEELVFRNGAVSLGSTLSPVVAILSEDDKVIKEFGRDNPENAVTFSYRFPKAGVYYVRISDYLESGRGSHFYRYMVGKLPVVTSAYPLGIEAGKSREIRISGFNLGKDKWVVKGEPSKEDESAVLLRPEAPAGPTFNKLKLALGPEPEMEASGANVSAASAQVVKLPVTINGKMPASGHFYRFSAKKGQPLVVEVNARRLDSELDSEVEILDAKGKPIEQGIARAVWETNTTLNERDSVSRGIRIQSWNALAVGDYLMIGGEILRIEAMPRGPDDDMLFESFNNQRIAFFNTTTEAHAVDKPAYKVQFFPPGSKHTPNGLPRVHLYYRNDDGGPGYGKDSYLQFTAPEDGEYILRIADVRGVGGDHYPYRVTLRAPRPDFRLSVNPRNPNVPQGGTIPLTVTAQRLDGFEGPIAVALEGLPAGLTATAGVIAPKQVTATILLSSGASTKLEHASPLLLTGKAEIAGRTVAHHANPEDATKLIALMPNPDVVMTAETREVVLEPGGTAEVTVTIRRQNGFGGRVPVEVRNLPPRVRVLDVGLNGVLLNEDETRRSFTLEALPSAEPVEQTIYVSGLIETRSPLQNSQAAPQAIRLIVRPKAVHAMSGKR